MGIIEDKINTAMRDFVRFTGDGKPGEPVDAALPVGDPASGEWNPPKKQVREAFVTLAGSAENVEGAVISAAASASAAQISEDNAAGSASTASADADAALAAANAIGPVTMYDTKADADLASPANDDIIDVLVDESRNGRRSRYRFDGSGLVFVLYLDDQDTIALRSTFVANNTNGDYDALPDGTQRVVEGIWYSKKLGDTSIAALPDWVATSIGFNIGEAKVRVVAGFLRNEGTGWEFIEDGGTGSGHRPIGVTAVEALGGVLKVTFAGPNAKVITAAIAPDEGYARQGLIMGASVGRDFMEIRGSLPLEFAIETDGSNAPIITAKSEVAGLVSASRQGYDLRVNHGGVLDQGPLIQPSLGSPEVVPDSVGDTAFNLKQVVAFASHYYRVRYNNSWQLITSNGDATLDSSTFTSNGRIKINLGTTLAADGNKYRSTSDDYARAQMYNSSLSEFTVQFVDAAGTVIKTATNGTMDSHINYGPPIKQFNKDANLPAGKYTVRRGRVPVSWDDMVSPDSYAANVNIGFFALLQDV